MTSAGPGPDPFHESTAGHDAPAAWSMDRYARVLLRRWLALLVCALLGLGAAAALLQVRPAQATASALVRLQVISDEPFGLTREPSGFIDAETEIQTARASTVLARAASELGGQTAADLRAGTKAELIPNGTVLRITYTADTVERAITGADEIARQFLRYRGELAAGQVSAVVRRLDDQRDLLRDDIARIDQRINSARPGSPRLARARADRALLAVELDDVTTRIGDLRGIDTTGGTVYSHARDLGAFVGPRPVMVLAAGGLTGLLLGLVVAFARDATDRRIRGADHVRSTGAGPVLARLHERTPVPASGDDPEVGRIWERLSATSALDRSLLTVLDLGPHRRTCGVAVDLAARLTERCGTADLLVVGHDVETRARLRDWLHLHEVDEQEGLILLASSRCPRLAVWWPADRAAPAREAAQLEEVLVERARQGVRTIVAVPWTADPSLSMVCGRLSAATVLSVVEGRTPRGLLKRTLEDLDAVHVRVAGTVLSRSAPSHVDVGRQAASAPERVRTTTSTGARSS